MSEKRCPICGCYRDLEYTESIKYLCGYWETPGKRHVSGCGNALQEVNELRAQLNIERNHCDSSASTIVSLRLQLAQAQAQCETTRELESAVVDLTCTISDLKAQLAQRDEDAAVGKAMRELPDASGMFVFHNDANSLFDLSMSTPNKYYRGKGATLCDALRAAGLLPSEEVKP